MARHKNRRSVREGSYTAYRARRAPTSTANACQVLLDAGKAYIAFDTPEELQAAREATPNFQYDASTRGQMRNSLTISAEEVERRIAEGEPYVVRFKKIEPGRGKSQSTIFSADVSR